MSGFIRGLDRFLSTLGKDALSTGSLKLDGLIGGVRQGSSTWSTATPNASRSCSTTSSSSA